MAATESVSSAANTGEIDIFHQFLEYKGVTLIAMQKPEILEALQDWETKPDDVYLVTYPKSGTHWIFEIVSLIKNDVEIEKIDRRRMVYALDLALSHSAEGLATITPGHEMMAKWESPRVMSSHILEEFAPEQIKKSSKVIYFSRNPKDVFVSYFKFVGPTLPAEMEGMKGFLPFFLSEKMFGGSWFRHVKGWFARKDDPNVLICKYEDFHKDLRGSIKRVADFLERPLSEEKLDKLVELTELKGMQKTYQQIEENMGEEGKSVTRLFGQLPYLRKGKVGNWKENLTVAQNEYFDQVYKQAMDGTDIEFEFEL
ncbi:sulfotransferase 1C3-like [Lytechinus pictus]|uniref:sulfotransferase 1C3-like n=1 Tax=Lytechinus pictus TaxID=7653 RepID=UPI0030B9EC12